MSDTDPGPDPAERGHKTSLDTLLTGVKEMLPAASIAIALPLLVVVTMPAGNEKAVLALISGILGFLTGRATSGRGGVK